MRKSPLAILFFVIGMAFHVSAVAQNDEATRVLSFIQKAMNYNRTVPQEKVYMHFDNTGYFMDETMWFKAYVTRTDLQIPTNLSKVLYVELLNPSGDIIRSHKYPINERGEAYGDMKLDTLFGSGFYEVRAYTRYMTNWGVNACFSRVFPIFEGAEDDADISGLSINTKLFQFRDPNNRSREDSLYLKAIEDGIHNNDVSAKTISLKFYPEGGDLIRGKKGRVAVLAVDDSGHPYSSDGFILNANGDVLANVRTDSLGRGLFELTPDGSALVCQMKNHNGKTQTFDLPDTKSRGCALTLDAVSDDMLITMQCSDDMNGRLLGFAVTNNGNITYCDTVAAAPLIEVELDRTKQRPGVNQFTVFDSTGHILAERMFFICPVPDAADSIRITNATPRLKPCGNVELDIQTEPNSSFSFSALDAAMMTNGKQGNMKTWMLLSSDVKGYIHNVDYYFEADDATHRKAAELLMLTQGWRRYDWEMMDGIRQFTKIQPIEDRFYLFGKLNEYRKKNPVNDVQLTAYLFNDKGESLSGETTTDADGNYAFALPFMNGEWKMQIFTRIDDKRKTFYVGIDRQFAPKPRYITPTETSLFRPNKANMFTPETLLPVAQEEEFIPITRRDHVLQNVTVKAKRRYFTNDDWTYKNERYGSRYATTFYDIDRELDAILDLGQRQPTIFQFLVQRNKAFYSYSVDLLPHGPSQEVLYRDSVAYPDWNGTLSYNHRPIRWIVDNGETQNIGGWSDDSKAGFDAHFPLFLDEIKTLYIAPNSPWEEEQATRVYIYTHKKFTTESQKGLRRTYFQGFSTPSTFQMEDYSILPPMADFRRTIYWNPNVKADAEGKAKIQFYNNSTCKEMYLSAEGLTPKGKVLISK